MALIYQFLATIPKVRQTASVKSVVLQISVGGLLLGINGSSRSKVSSGELNGLSYFGLFEPLFHLERFSPKEPRFW